MITLLPPELIQYLLKFCDTPTSLALGQVSHWLHDCCLVGKWNRKTAFNQATMAQLWLNSEWEQIYLRVVVEGEPCPKPDFLCVAHDDRQNEWFERFMQKRVSENPVEAIHPENAPRSLPDSWVGAEVFHQALRGDTREVHMGLQLEGEPDPLFDWNHGLTLAMILRDDIQTLHELASWDELIDVFRIFGTAQQADFLFDHIPSLELFFMTSQKPCQVSFITEEIFFDEALPEVCWLPENHEALLVLGNKSPRYACAMAGLIGPYQNFGPGLVRDACYLYQSSHLDPLDPCYPDDVNNTHLMPHLDFDEYWHVADFGPARLAGMAHMELHTDFQSGAPREFQLGEAVMLVRLVQQQNCPVEKLDVIPDELVQDALNFARTIGFDAGIQLLEARSS